MFKPTGDNILIEQCSADTITTGGILIPDTIAKKPLKGVVIAVGQGRKIKNNKRVKLTVSVGDTVLFTKHGITEVTLDSKILFILPESKLIAILKE